MTVGVFVLAVAMELSWRGLTGATSLSSGSASTISSTGGSSLESYSYAFYTDDDANLYYPDCNMPASDIGDGYCDDNLNNVQCGWDGGDCCECTCDSSSSNYGCYSWGYDCKNADAPFTVNDTCHNVSFQAPGVTPCTDDIPIQWIVENTTGATNLADAIMCSGGNFEVEWRGHVPITTTIHVVNRTVLYINGGSDANADGGGTIQMFLVANGSLHLSDLIISNGNGPEGGAITAHEGSQIYAERVMFNSNNAQILGGAVYAAFSTVDLISTTFDGNSASDGGAIYLRRSVVIGSGSTSFDGNNASRNGGALYIGLRSHVGLNMDPLVYEHVRNYTNELSSSTSTVWFTDSTTDWTVVEPSGEIVFRNNIAGESGGAIFATDDSKISAYGNTSFTLNRADVDG